MRPHVAVLDIGSGNLRSAEKAFAHVGADTCITNAVSYTHLTLPTM